MTDHDIDVINNAIEDLEKVIALWYAKMPFEDTDADSIEENLWQWVNETPADSSGEAFLADLLQTLLNGYILDFDKIEQIVNGDNYFRSNKTNSSERE